MAVDVWQKTSWEEVDVGFDCADAISDGDSLASVAVAVVDAGVDISAWMAVGSPQIDGTTVTQRFGGGVPGATYRAHLGIVTANGEQIPKALDIIILDDGTPTTGTGSVAWTYTLTDDTEAADPIADARVWVSTDEDGATVVASGTTAADGTVTLQLDAGTVYLWRAKQGVEFQNPDPQTVA